MKMTEIAGVVIDLDKVPNRDEPAESHVRYTGQGYVQEDGTSVAVGEMVAGPVGGYTTETPGEQET